MTILAPIKVNQMHSKDVLNGLNGSFRLAISLGVIGSAKRKTCTMGILKTSLKPKGEAVI